MGNKSTNWALTDLSGGVKDGSPGANVFIKIDGQSVPFAQLSLSYGLNAIPSAQALIALGRNARTQEQSSIYSLVSNIKQMAQVLITASGPFGDWSPHGGDNGGKQQWPEAEEHILFVGYVSGISYRRSLGRVSLVLSMVNKLVDLTMSSGGSADVVPGAPHDLLLPSLYQGAGGASISMAADKFVQDMPLGLQTDFSKSVLKALYAVSKDNQLQIHDAWCKGGVGGQLLNKLRNNEVAARVIEGFGAWQGIANYDGVDAEFTEAYPLQIHTAGCEHTASRIGDVLANSLSGTNLWSVLIDGIIPEFGVCLIPMAQKAILAPVLMMSETAGAIISVSEYADFDMSTLSPRPLYGVGVMGSYSTATVANSKTDNKQCVGATFVAKADDGSPLSDGMWMFVPSPSWITDWANFDPAALSGEAGVVKLMNQPSHDAVGVAAEAVQRDPDAETEDWNAVMSKYAQMMYAANALRGRVGTIVGKLRFDIAPGTTVQILAKGEVGSLEGTDELASNMFGLVARVTISINAESTSATTTFELTNLRTSVENESPRFSMATHPFFNKAFFKTAPIVPSLSVKP